MLKENMTILFQGDSITDCGWMSDPEELGYGYARMVAKAATALYPDYDLKFINRGIGGNRVIDLKNRWDADCIALKPDILFIFIGINDTWRKYDANDPTTAQAFENTYREIIQKAKSETAAEIVLIEPFVLPVVPGQETWWEDLCEKQLCVRRLSREFSLRLIPLDGIFAKESALVDPAVFASDGVHPTNAGARVIAKAILKVLEK